MGEKELFKFGDKELNVNSLLNNITSNLQSYLDYYSNSIGDSNLFLEKVNYIKEGIKNGSITTDGTGVYRDANGKLSQDDALMNNVLHFVNVIATELSKKTRSLTKSELDAREQEKKRKQAELERQRIEREDIQRNTKPAFTPPEGWNVATSFAHSFNQNGLIPYDLLQQLVTTDPDGNPVYTDLHAQLDKNFDSISKQLELFSGTESYIDNINLFKNALKDGDLSPQDRFLGMELGFQNSELDKLNTLIKYKINKEEPEPVVEEKEETKQNTPEFVQNPLESDESFKRRIDASRATDKYYTTVMNSVNFEKFLPAKKLKLDSEEAFKKLLRQYIYNWVIDSNNSGLTKRYYVPGGIGYSSTIVPLMDITPESLSYMDPKLYNELGLKYFSNYSASKMYKHFKDLVDQQNKEATKHEKGGILKAENGLKTPWRLNFDGTIHQMDNIYKLFTDNIQSYDAKQMAEALNKLNGDDYKSLNFGGADNTLGFKNWNTVFNESGLNNLFGYNEGKSDYLGVTTKSRNSFVDYLKGKGSINTGNGDLLWNPESNSWEYANWSNKTPEVEAEVATTNATESALKAPESADLTLKDLDLKKPMDFNPNGMINSAVGYVVNEFANARKREILKDIPLYLEQVGPEKAFKTAYTYDLEKAKNEVMADANSIQPITSDASVYYDAKLKAIKNAREYTTKLDTEINDRVHQVASDNLDIAYDNAVTRANTAKTNAKNMHDWDVEQKLGEVDYIEARNQSFQNLNKEIKHNVVTNARKRQKQRDAYMNKYILTGLTTNPANYIDGWTKHHDLIWFKGLNGQLETDQELIEYQQLLSIVNQASMNLFAQYENINYPGAGTLHTHATLNEAYDPNKHGVAIVGAKGMKIDKLKIGNFINKLK